MATTYKETFWDCPECHEPNISGVFNPYGRRCPNCLYHRRDSDLLEVRDISKVITDVELQQAAHSPDLVCGNPACKAEFADEGLALHLIQCPRCESWMNDWVEKKAVDSEFGEAIAQTQASPATRMENIAKVYGEAPPPTRKGQRAIARKLAIGSAAAAGLLGVSIGGLMLFASTPVAFTVEGKYYEMTTTVETYLPRSAADWEENVPTVAYQPGDAISADQPTAYEVDSKRVERKVRSTQDVPVSRFGVGRGVATILPFHASAKTYLLADCTVGGNGVAICQDAPSTVEEEAGSLEEAPLIPDAPDTDYQTEEVWDVWVDYTEWSWQRDRQETVEGAGDVPSEIATLRLSPMQRATNRAPICYVEGTYSLADDLDEAAETDIFEIDCDESRQLNIGETAALMMRDRYVWIDSEY
ncbi:MAG: hypothetical protein AB8B99_09430 [Phormidesmis sp.]